MPGKSKRKQHEICDKQTNQDGANTGGYKATNAYRHPEPAL